MRYCVHYNEITNLIILTGLTLDALMYLLTPHSPGPKSQSNLQYIYIPNKCAITRNGPN